MAFTARAFTFLAELEKNNNKTWFDGHKADYEAAIREPALQFIDDAGEWLEAAKLPYVADARKSGGSLSRIYRDTRFSADKTPYHTYVHMVFMHKAATDEHPMPGIGIRWDKNGAGVGAGCWMGGTPVLNKVRDAIVADPTAWTKAKKGLYMEHPAYAPPLKTAPRGYDKNHPLIDDLRRTTFAVDVPLTKKQFTGDLMGAFQGAVGQMRPFLGFMNEALE